MEPDPRKKRRRDSTMRSKSPDTQEARETGRKEAGEPRGPPIPRMGTTEDVLQVEGKECEDQERPKMRRRKPMPERGRCPSMGQATPSGPVAADEERPEAAARNSAGEKEEQKDERDSTEHAARRSPARQPPTPPRRAPGRDTEKRDPRQAAQTEAEPPGEEQSGKLGEEEDEEGEPAIERRRERTDSGLDLGEREVQVVRHASAPATTDEARREAEMQARRPPSPPRAAAKVLRPPPTASPTPADHQAPGGRPMRPKGMEDPAAPTAREAKRAAAEERERDEHSPAVGQ